MKLFVMFGQRKQSYDGEFGPEALLCWDEFCVDEHPDGFDEACEKSRKEASAEFSAVRVVAVSVDQDKICRLLNGTPTVAGKVEDA